LIGSYINSIVIVIDIEDQQFHLRMALIAPEKILDKFLYEVDKLLNWHIKTESLKILSSRILVKEFGLQLIGFTTSLVTVYIFWLIPSRLQGASAGMKTRCYVRRYMQSAT